MNLVDVGLQKCLKVDKKVLFSFPDLLSTIFLLNTGE